MVQCLPPSSVVTCSSGWQQRQCTCAWKRLQALSDTPSCCCVTCRHRCLLWCSVVLRSQFAAAVPPGTGNSVVCLAELSQPVLVFLTLLVQTSTLALETPAAAVTPTLSVAPARTCKHLLMAHLASPATAMMATYGTKAHSCAKVCVRCLDHCASA